MITRYSLQSFAEMRGYATEELEQLDKKSLKIEEKMEQRETQFMEKYGSDRSKWFDDVWDEYEYGDDH